MEATSQKRRRRSIRNLRRSSTSFLVPNTSFLDDVDPQLASDDDRCTELVPAYGSAWITEGDLDSYPSTSSRGQVPEPGTVYLNAEISPQQRNDFTFHEQILCPEKNVHILTSKGMKRQSTTLGSDGEAFIEDHEKRRTSSIETARFDCMTEAADVCHQSAEKILISPPYSPSDSHADHGFAGSFEMEDFVDTKEKSKEDSMMGCKYGESELDSNLACLNQGFVTHVEISPQTDVCTPRNGNRPQAKCSLYDVDKDNSGSNLAWNILNNTYRVSPVEPLNTAFCTPASMRPHGTPDCYSVSGTTNDADNQHIVLTFRKLADKQIAAKVMPPSEKQSSLVETQHRNIAPQDTSRELQRKSSQDPHLKKQGSTKSTGVRKEARKYCSDRSQSGVQAQQSQRTLLGNSHIKAASMQSVATEKRTKSSVKGKAAGAKTASSSSLQCQLTPLHSTAENQSTPLTCHQNSNSSQQQLSLMSASNSNASMDHIIHQLSSKLRALQASAGITMGHAIGDLQVESKQERNDTENNEACIPDVKDENRNRNIFVPQEQCSLAGIEYSEKSSTENEALKNCKQKKRRRLSLKKDSRVAAASEDDIKHTSTVTGSVSKIASCVLEIPEQCTENFQVRKEENNISQGAASLGVETTAVTTVKPEEHDTHVKNKTRSVAEITENMEQVLETEAGLARPETSLRQPKSKNRSKSGRRKSEQFFSSVEAEAKTVYKEKKRKSEHINPGAHNHSSGFSNIHETPLSELPKDVNVDVHLSPRSASSQVMVSHSLISKVQEVEMEAIRPLMTSFSSSTEYPQEDKENVCARHKQSEKSVNDLKLADYQALLLEDLHRAGNFPLDNTELVNEMIDGFESLFVGEESQLELGNDSSVRNQKKNRKEKQKRRSSNIYRASADNDGHLDSRDQANNIFPPSSSSVTDKDKFAGTEDLGNLKLSNVLCEIGQEKVDQSDKCLHTNSFELSVKSEQTGQVCNTYDLPHESPVQTDNIRKSLRTRSRKSWDTFQVADRNSTDSSREAARPHDLQRSAEVQNPFTCDQNDDSESISPALEKLYRNKDYVLPKPRAWENIKENPSFDKPLFSKQKSKRFIIFDGNVSRAKLDRRHKKALDIRKRGGVKVMTVTDEEFESKMLAIQLFLDSTP